MLKIYETAMLLQNSSFYLYLAMLRMKLKVLVLLQGHEFIRALLFLGGIVIWSLKGLGES